MLRRYFKQFVRTDELQGLLQAQDLGRRELQGIVGTGSTGVGQLLFLADIQFDVFLLRIFPDDHTGIYFFARTDEQITAILCVEQTISNGFAGFKCDQGTLFAVADLTFKRCIAFKNRVDDTVAFGIGHKLATITDQTAGRDHKLQTGVAAAGSAHIQELALAGAQFFNNCSGEFFRNINVSSFHRLGLPTVLVFVVKHFCFTYGKLIAFTAHILDQHGQMQLATSGYLEGFGGIGFFHTKGYVGV